MEISLFYTCAPKILMIFIHSSWDYECDWVKLVIMGHFLPSPLSPETLKKSVFWKIEENVLETSFYICVPQMTIIWCIFPEIWSATEFFIILDYFLPFYLLKNLENQDFAKMKKVLGDIIILHMCTIFFFLILHHFLPYLPPPPPLTTQIKILKKMKKIPGDIIILHDCTKNKIICYTVPEIWCVVD